MKLIIFSDLPGTGKSTLAETVGKRLAIPVFAKDWLEAAMVRCELLSSNPAQPLGWAGYQLLTTLAECQLMLGQSVTLDSIASTLRKRNTWRELVEQYQAKRLVIECLCSDGILPPHSFNKARAGHSRLA